MDSVFLRKSTGFFTMKTRKNDTCRENVFLEEKGLVPDKR